MSDKLRQRVSLDTCARCRKKFEPGHRVLQVFIIQKVQGNPLRGDAGAWLGDEFEFVHASCADPGLDGHILHLT